MGDSGWKIRLTVKRLPDGRAELSATTHLTKPDDARLTPSLYKSFVEQSIAIGPEGSGATAKTAFEWACERLRAVLGDEG